MKTIWSCSASALVGLLYPVLALAQQPAWDGTGPWHMMGGGWGFWWIFPMFMFFFMIVVGIAVFVLAHRAGCGWHSRWGSGQTPNRFAGPGIAQGDPAYSALQILNERYAKGEIQKQEYEEKKAAILSSGPR